MPDVRLAASSCVVRDKLISTMLTGSQLWDGSCSDEQRDVALRQSMVKTLGRCLLGSSEANKMVSPSFSISTGLAAIYRLVQQPVLLDAQNHEHVLWQQVGHNFHSEAGAP